MRSLAGVAPAEEPVRPSSFPPSPPVSEAAFDGADELAAVLPSVAGRSAF